MKAAVGAYSGQPGLEVGYAITPDGLSQHVLIDGREFTTDRVANEAPLSGDPSDSWWLEFLRGSPAYPRKRRGSIRVADLFCGSGGLSLGVREAAHALGLSLEHEFAVDADPAALDIFSTNHRPRITTTESVASLVSYQVSTRSGRAAFTHEPQLLGSELPPLVGAIDVLLAGPPCQGHSTVNNHTRFNDPRNLLYLAVPAIAVALDAGSVIIENVPGVTASREGVVSQTTDLLKGAGYSVTSCVLRSDSMGWPQRRRRFFLVATKGREPLDLAAVQTALAHEPRAIAWALSDILSSDEQSPMTIAPAVSAATQRRIDFLHDNDVFDLPNDQRPDCHKNGTTYRSVYGRMRWDEPASTLTTGFMTAGRGRFVHPIERRTLLPREAARLQGFPDTYRFERLGTTPATRTAIAKGIGDAVPTPMGFAAGLSALGRWTEA